MKISKADLHVHTSYSFDALSEPKDIVDAAIAKGLKVIAITDHNKIDGAIKAQKYAKRKRIEVIIGEEIYTGEGELLGLFLTSRVAPKLGLKKTVQAIRQQGGVVIVPHPFNWATLKETITVKRMKSIQNIVDGIEVINPSYFGSRARKRIPKLNHTYGLAKIGSSDAHHASLVGMAYTYFEGTTAEELKNAILRKETEPGYDELTNPYEIMWLLTQNIKKYGKKTFSKASKIEFNIYD